jgi:hypothetical protein
MRSHRKDRRLSIIGTTGLIGSMFAPAAGRMSAGEWFTTGKIFNPQGKDLYDFANDLLAQYTGIDTREGWPRFSIPWGLVTVVASQLGAKAVQKFGGKALNNIPIVGKYVKW